MERLKALSISLPWPSAIEKHGKRAENRPRWVNARGTLAQARRLIGQDIALHSSGTWDQEGADYIQKVTGVRYTRQSVPAKAITSVARLAGVLMPGDPCPEGQQLWYWGDIALLLDDVRVLPQPVPMLGGLGWLEVPADKLAQVTAQLEAMKAAGELDLDDWPSLFEAQV